MSGLLDHNDGAKRSAFEPRHERSKRAPSRWDLGQWHRVGMGVITVGIDGQPITAGGGVDERHWLWQRVGAPTDPTRVKRETTDIDPARVNARTGATDSARVKHQTAPSDPARVKRGTTDIDPARVNARTGAVVGAGRSLAGNRGRLTPVGRCCLDEMGL